MAAPELVRRTSHGVTLLDDPHRPGGVTLAFTERTGGFSTNEFASLNVGITTSDSRETVRRNQHLALKALGVGDLAESLVCPVQVHGDNVLVIGSRGLSAEQARIEAANGYDAIVCVEKNVPVLMSFADCVPVILAVPNGFAVIHSGWRGTMLRIASKALCVLLDVGECDVTQALAYVGPHIGVRDYEVSRELVHDFEREFGSGVIQGERNLDLGEAVILALEDVGLHRDQVAVVTESTASHTQRFYSYRAESGRCGRHGAVACLLEGLREEAKA